jgi:thiamine biosynthesis lipoprotein
MDPRTGRPALTGVVESSAVAPDCLTADALATALFVLGAEEGMEVIREQPGLGGIVVTQEGEEFSVTASPGLEIVNP